MQTNTRCARLSFAADQQQAFHSGSPARLLTMRAVVCENLGDPTLSLGSGVLRLSQDTPTPEVKPGQQQKLCHQHICSRERARVFLRMKPTVRRFVSRWLTCIAFQESTDSIRCSKQWSSTFAPMPGASAFSNPGSIFCMLW